MRPDYSPFSVALIDIFASAMGVFMVFSFISLPFVLNTDSASVVKVNKLEKELNQIKMIFNQNHEMQLPIIFDGNQWYIRPDSQSIVDMLGREISVNSANVRIVGHTSNKEDTSRTIYCHWVDEYGDVKSGARLNDFKSNSVIEKRCETSSEWNIFLSTRRAESIKNYLVENYDVLPERISAYGVGSKDHLTNVAAEDSRNRRVEVFYDHDDFIETPTSKSDL